MLRSRRALLLGAIAATLTRVEGAVAYQPGPIIAGAAFIPTIDVARAYWHGGNSKAVIIEYIDFECPYCRENTSYIRELIKEKGPSFSLILKHLTINDSHVFAYRLAAYYESLRLQETNYSSAFHDLAFDYLHGGSGLGRFLAHPDEVAERDQLFLSKIDAAALLAGGELDRVRMDWTEVDIQEIISNDVTEALKLGAAATPFFWSNGKSFSGVQDYDSLSKMIEAQE